MTNNTAGLSLQEAFRQAEQEELALSEAGPEADTEGLEPKPEPQGEQPAVEDSSQDGLFSGLDEQEGQEEQPTEDSFEVTVDGETFLVNVDELRSGYMRQADYTRKTQELKELERQAERATKLVAMLEEQPRATLQKLYQRVNAGQSLDIAGDMSPQTVQETKGPEDIEALVEARVAAMLERDPRIQQLQQQQWLTKLETVFDKIQKDYSVQLTDADKQKVLEKAKAQNIQTVEQLEDVFGAMYAKYLAQERKRDGERKNMRSVQPVKGEGRVDEFNPQSEQKPRKYNSFRDALEEELALMEQEGESF